MNSVAEKFLRNDFRISILATIAALMIVAAGVFARSAAPLNHDVSWLFVAAERLSEGGRLGVDIFELNAPGAVALYLPAVALTHWYGWTPKLAILTYTGIMIGLVLLLSGHLLRKLLGPAATWRGELVVLSWAAIWVLVPGYDFAQREHFIVLLLLPYVLLESCLASGISVANAWRVIASLTAVAAMAIKPHYALVPAGFLVLRLMRRGVRDVVRSPEPWILLIVGLGYLLLVLTLCREWMEVARKAQVLYRPYDGDWTSVLRLADGIPGPTAMHGLSSLVLIPLAVRSILSRDPILARTIQNFYLAFVISLMIYLVQRKGFTYHLLPLTMLVLSSMPVMLAAAMEMRWSFARPSITKLAGALLMTATIPLSLSAAPQGPAINLSLARELAARTGGGAVYAFTTGMRPMFPLVTEQGLRWGSRFPCLWTLVGIYHQRFPSGRDIPQLPPDQLDALEAELVDQVVEDFRRYRPATVVVDVAARKQWLNGPLDFVYFFSADPRFEEIWRGYRQVGKVGAYEIYARTNQ